MDNMTTIFITAKRDCCGCFACADICPNGCIDMRADEEGFLYPHIDRSRCIHCKLCERVCPTINGAAETGESMPEGYALINRNDKIRLSSSSGGAFSLFAEYVIKAGGIVFGAVMSEDCKTVMHVGVDSLLELARLRGSKYMQSSIGNAYIEVRYELEKGRKVLFTGTPCQIEGLRCFLGKNYENLLCIDLICHGVPSPAVWKKYVAFREGRAGAAVRQTFFRHKKYGWKTYALLFEYSNNKAYVRKHPDDPYMRAFLQNLCLRPSCHACHFKKINRVSDITLGDYWGVQKQYPDMDDDTGTSLVIIHTKKGRHILKEISGMARMTPIEIKEALKDNRAMVESAVPGRKRAEFMAAVNTLDFANVIKAYLKEPITFKNIVKRLLRRTNMDIFLRKV